MFALLLQFIRFPHVKNNTSQRAFLLQSSCSRLACD